MQKQTRAWQSKDISTRTTNLVPTELVVSWSRISDRVNKNSTTYTPEHIGTDLEQITWRRRAVSVQRAYNLLSSFWSLWFLVHHLHCHNLICNASQRYNNNNITATTKITYNLLNMAKTRMVTAKTSPVYPSVTRLGHRRLDHAKAVLPW